MGVCVVAVPVIIRYKFVSKREFEESQKKCQAGMCLKINAVKTYGSEKTDVLTGGARDSAATLDAIRNEIAEVRVDIAGLRASFEQYLKDIAKKD